MDSDIFAWLLLALPVAFALGWMASRFDARQMQAEARRSPRAYYRGLNFLLNEQQDEAVDAFIEAVQQDPGTTDLHFSIGELFRKRGEYERAVRVHEHLLQRADLPQSERERATLALARDFMKAGLFDRAETAFQALRGTSLESQALLALLSLYERSREWDLSTGIAQELERTGHGSFSARCAHHWCEKFEETQDSQWLEKAMAVAPHAPRAWVLMAREAHQKGQHDVALKHFEQVHDRHPAHLALVAKEAAESALAEGQSAPWTQRFVDLQARAPSTDWIEALALLDPAGQHERVVSWLDQQAGLLAVVQALEVGCLSQAPGDAGAEAAARQLREAAQPLRRYHCASCSFQAHRFFWQCPGCHNWDSLQPTRIGEL